MNSLYLCLESIADITFGISPKFNINANKSTLPFTGLFTVQFRVPALDTDHVAETIPTLFILMKDRNRATFKSAFEFVKKRLVEKYNYKMEKQSDDMKRIIGFDYEVALREEYCSIFEIDECNGCLMHFSSNIYKNMISYGMKDALDYTIEDNREFYHTVQKIKVISLLPPDLQLDGWEIVKEELKDSVPYGFKRKLKKFMKKYFEKWYVKGEHFELKHWNFYRSTNRTQGSIEASHKVWHQKIGSHPLIWKFVEFLQMEDALAEMRYEQIQAHFGKTRRKRINERKKEDALERLWNCLDDEYLSISEFLACASVAIKMNWKVLKKLVTEYEISYFFNVEKFFNEDE